jgi:flavodoxin short chain
MGKMKKIVVYWSGTGNTLEIANKIAEDLGCEAVSVSDANVDEVLANDLIVFGCPAMGAEELEEDEFKPFYESVMQSIGDKKVALFGSYGWGDGEWMRNWEQEVSSNLATSGLIVNGGVSDIDDASYDEFINALK